MWSKVGLGLLAISSLISVAGCSSPDVAEKEESSASKLSACQLAGAVTTATATVAVYSATATGVCAEGAVAATAVSGGVAAPGALVCLAPAAGAALSGIVAILGAGITMLTCGSDQSQVQAADSTSTTGTTDDTGTCDGATYQALGRAKGAACDNLPSSCTNYSGSGQMTSSFCVNLQLRQNEYQKCLDARKAVIDQCFGGQATDQAHQDQVDTMQREVDACQQLMDSSCNGGSNQPNGDDDDSTQNQQNTDQQSNNDPQNTDDPVQTASNDDDDDDDSTQNAHSARRRH